MQCPKCNYVLNDFDEECPRCSRMSAANPAPVQPATTSPAPAPTPTVQTGASLLGVAGMILGVIGVLVACYFFFIFNTTVEVPTTYFMGTSIGGGYVNNIGLMSQRQNGILFGFGMAIVGILLFVIDRSNHNRIPITDRQKKSLTIGVIGVVVCAVVFVGILAIMGSQVKNTFESVPTSTLSPAEIIKFDASSIKQLGLAVFYYGEKHNDLFPDMSSPESLKDAVEPFLPEGSDNDIFYQYHVNDPFLGNASLSNTSYATIDDPSKIVLIYQNTPYPDGKRSVIFTDGHYQLVSNQTWQKLKQQSNIQ